MDHLLGCGLESIVFPQYWNCGILELWNAEVLLLHGDGRPFTLLTQLCADIYNLFGK